MTAGQETDMTEKEKREIVEGLANMKTAIDRLAAAYEKFGVALAMSLRRFVLIMDAYKRRN